MEIKSDKILKSLFKLWLKYNQFIFWGLILAVFLLTAWLFWRYALRATTQQVGLTEIDFGLSRQERNNVKDILEKRRITDDLIIRDVFR